MKTKTLFIATTLAALGLMAAACKEKNPEPNVATDPKGISNTLAPVAGLRYVTVKDGLNMREEPSPTGKKMATIPYKEGVLKLEEMSETFTIDKTEGKWTKITWQGKTGWVFGGFLSWSSPDSGSTQSASNAESSANCEKKCEERQIEETRRCNEVGHSRSTGEYDESIQADCRSGVKHEAEQCKSKC